MPFGNLIKRRPAYGIETRAASGKNEKDKESICPDYSGANVVGPCGVDESGFECDTQKQREVDSGAVPQKSEGTIATLPGTFAPVALPRADVAHH
jgi:hypothetical protein